MNLEYFIKEVNDLGINLTEKQLTQLEDYYKLLIEWNSKINLTRIVEKEEVYLKHFYDSLTLNKVAKYFMDLDKEITICDVGTGAGFPGIVLKIVFPNIKITLVDSLQKRINFLNEVIKKLNLKNIETVHSRVEDYAKNNREKFDIVTSRAVANLRVLSELCIPLVKVSGYFIPMKANIEEEIEDSKKILNSLNSEISTIYTFNLPVENSIRNIIVIKKLAKTNPIYPRRIDKIK